MLTVPSGALTGPVFVEQDGVLSNGKHFTVTPSGGGGGTMTLAPDIMNMALGDTRGIQALNASSQPVTGLTWTSSNPNIVSLSSDDPPLLTALAVGRVTITAGTASAVVTVSATLPTGTVLWSNPGDGSGVSSIVPAVPSATGVADVFAFQNDGTVQAIASDGKTAWTADVSILQSAPALALPDFQGGLVVASCDRPTGNVSITKLDGITGQAYSTYTSTDRCDFGGATVVHPDGTVFLAEAFPSNVVGIDPITGTKKFSVPLIQGNVNAIEDPFTAPNEPNTSIYSAIVAGDGNAYIAYGYQDAVGAATNPNIPEACCFVTHLMLLKVNSSGEYDQIDVNDWTTESPTGLLGQVSVHMITNADQGVVLAWEGDPIGHDGGGPPTWASQVKSNLHPQHGSIRQTSKDFVQTPVFGMAITSGTSVTLIAPPSIPGQSSSLIPVLQAQDGSFVGQIGIGPGPMVIDQETNDVTQYNMVSFDASGNVRWIVPNEQPQIATADGGVIGQSGITYDSNGNATGQTTLLTQSWLGNAYEVGSIDQILALQYLIATSFWAFQGANVSGNGTGIGLDLFPELVTCHQRYGNCQQRSGPRDLMFNAKDDLVRRLTTDQTCFNAAKTAVFNKVLYGGVGGFFAHPIDGAKFIAYLEATQHFYDGSRSHLERIDLGAIGNPKYV